MWSFTSSEKSTWLCLVGLLMYSNITIAQDLIVTQQGDSINCKITRVKQGYVHFTFVHKDEVRNTLLATDQISTYQQGFFEHSEIPEQVVNTIEKNYHGFRFGIQIGPGIRTASIPSEYHPSFRDHLKKQRIGFHVDTDAHWYWSETMGLGFRYSAFMTGSETRNVQIPDAGSGYLSEQIAMHFIGPSLSNRFVLANPKNTFLTNFALGYMGYRNNVSTNNRSFLMTGNTIGLAMEVGYDVEIGKNTALGFSIAAYVGSLNSVNIGSGSSKQKMSLDDGERENLSRIDFTIGYRYLK
ncbi:MAG: hypothetical protein JJU28_17890 [Cyclobacteriaceae bacterium]|nr:hypothetical protein [Cyclobacteriaceae bacterium]